MRLNLNFLRNLDKRIQKQWKQHPNNELRRIENITSYSFCCYSCFNSKSIFGTIFNLVIFIKRLYQQILCKMGSKMFHDIIFWQKHSGILPNKCCKNLHTEMEISSDMKFQKVFLFFWCTLYIPIPKIQLPLHFHKNLRGHLCSYLEGLSLIHI